MNKIYTKTGDKGETSLYDLSRVSKNHPRISSVGSLDELSSFIGLTLSFEELNFEKEFLQDIQNKLFLISSHIATQDIKVREKLDKINEKIVLDLEIKIDSMNEKLPELTNFILPGGARCVSYIHVCRSVCRRCEREIVLIKDEIEELILKYINRLSDYFFVLARKINYDLGNEEIILN